MKTLIGFLESVEKDASVYFILPSGLIVGKVASKYAAQKIEIETSLVFGYQIEIKIIIDTSKIIGWGTK